jgi:hypothetical protein
MKKNVAGQSVGAQMIDLDGSGNEGSDPVLVYVTKDGGAMALGSVGGGGATHEGHGYYSYAPAQAETNANHVAFTFVGAGAIPVTVQVYPEAFPATGDAYDLLASLLGTDGLLNVNVQAFQGRSDVVRKMVRLAKGIVEVTVGAGSTTTIVQPANLAPDSVTDGQFNGKILTFEDDTITEGLRAQSTNITGASATGGLTVTALTHAPVAGDEATIS